MTLNVPNTYLLDNKCNLYHEDRILLILHIVILRLTTNEAFDNPYTRRPAFSTAVKKIHILSHFDLVNAQQIVI